MFYSDVNSLQIEPILMAFVSSQITIKMLLVGLSYIHQFLPFNCLVEYGYAS